MRTLRFLSLALPLLAAIGCQPPEHAVLLEIHSPDAVTELRVFVQSLEGPRRHPEPIYRVDRSAASIAEEPIRVAVELDRPEYVLVHLEATRPDGDRLVATRCYPVDGVITDEVLLFGPLGDLDPDGDGFVDDPASICRKPGPNGTVQLCDGDLYLCPAERARDCSPDDATIHPVAPTICLDGIDQNCDGIDEPCEDVDGDGWNACPENPTAPCDCDDSNPGIHPDAHDICLDGIDQDCDGMDACCDADGDGVVRCADGLPDCDDSDPTIPGTEVCDGVDNNCNGLIDELDSCRGPDLDGDGVPACGRPEAGAICDCNDCDPAVHGGGVERCFPPGIDEDCDGIIDEGCSPNDADGDGVDASRDCDDNDPLFFPPTDGREPPGDICEDGRSNNCLPGQDTSCADDLDGDGWVEFNDCENDPMRTPGKPEICNGIDDDCDGIIDEGLSGGRDTGWGTVGCVNGVEVRYETDLTHCGSCRYTCDVDRANACVDGSCVCSATGAECAASESCCGDGCFDLMNDDAHCGDCNIACGQGETCVNGVCTCGSTTGSGMPGPNAQACPDTSVGSVENNVCCGGACRDVSTDPNNCGMCGATCGSNALCTSSHCVCMGTWANCDGDFMANGCEVDTVTDRRNCGSCGRECQGGHATWACVASTCEPTSCDPGWGDCNALREDGCETNITTSNAHCGGCGNACGSGRQCNAGMCVSVCGDGIVTSDEACDDRNRNSGDGCRGDCRMVETGWTCPTPGAPCTPICGDGVVLGSETCDDGNTNSGDGCRGDCRMVETGWTCPAGGGVCAPICGDGIVAGTETCDDGNINSGDGCRADCRMIETGWTCPAGGGMCAPTCGDGRVVGSEVCDDGNINSGDGCRGDCRMVETGWVCSTPGTMCTPTCGDGRVLGSEICDDGNIDDGDGCRGDCRMVETGWVCPTPGAPCTPICGDGVVLGSETCDDGNIDDGDGCSRTCAVESGWDCDGASPTTCTPLCGNGVDDSGEICDDGNQSDCGTCSADCQSINTSVMGCSAGTGCRSNDDCESNDCNASGVCE